MSKPFIRWAGSKRKILPTLARYWNDPASRYIEPFAGSAQLFYHINPESAILSDINRDLIYTYKAVKKDPSLVFNKLIELPVGKKSYYKIRAEQVDRSDRTQLAARFIYLNRFCFNGLYRTNLKGEFNVPYSGYKTGGLPSLNDLENVSHILKKSKLVCGDFQEVIERNVSKGDFVYLDPPYAVENKRIFNQYDPASFGLHDLERLTELLHLIEKRKANFLLSYAYDVSIKKMFSDWSIKTVNTQRNISGFKKDQRMSKELLISNII